MPGVGAGPASVLGVGLCAGTLVSSWLTETVLSPAGLVGWGTSVDFEPPGRFEHEGRGRVGVPVVGRGPPGVFVFVGCGRLAVPVVGRGADVGFETAEVGFEEAEVGRGAEVGCELPEVGCEVADVLIDVGRVPPVLQLPVGAPRADEVLRPNWSTSWPGSGNWTSVPSGTPQPLPTLATNMSGRLSR